MSSYHWPGVGAVEAVGPGLYVDAVGNLHVDVEKVLAYLGAENTPANRELVTQALLAESQRRWPDTPAEVLE